MTLFDADQSTINAQFEAGRVRQQQSMDLGIVGFEVA